MPSLAICRMTIELLDLDQNWPGRSHRLKRFRGIAESASLKEDMRKKDLDEALERLGRERPAPSLPSTFEANVWRAIRERRAAAREPSVFDNLLAILFRPAGAFSAAAVTVAIAIGAGFLENAYSGRASEMSIFAANAPSLPSTLIGQPK